MGDEAQDADSGVPTGKNGRADETKIEIVTPDGTEMVSLSEADRVKYLMDKTDTPADADVNEYPAVAVQENDGEYTVFNNSWINAVRAGERGNEYDFTVITAEDHITIHDAGGYEVAHWTSDEFSDTGALSAAVNAVQMAENNPEKLLRNLYGSVDAWERERERRKPEWDLLAV